MTSVNLIALALAVLGLSGCRSVDSNTAGGVPSGEAHAVQVLADPG